MKAGYPSGLLCLLSVALTLSACTDVDVTVVNPTPASGSPVATNPPPPATSTMPPPTLTPTTGGVTGTATPSPTGPTPTTGAATSTPTPSPTVGGGPTIGVHACTVNPATSKITLRSSLFTLPVPNVGGTLQLDCGSIDPATGRAPCTPGLQLDPVNVSGIGFVCANAAPGCPTGEIDCDGGTRLDIDLLQDHNIGACTDNASCTESCEAACAGMERAFFDSGCTGFCEGGERDGQTCTTDAGCPGGSCTGKDDLTDPNICQCQCLGIGGNPSRPGGLLVYVGAQLNVEAAAPCDGQNVLIALPPLCIPVTSEQAAGLLVDANNIPESTIGPFSVSGLPISCDDLAADSTTGMKLAAQISFFDSTLGDLESQLELVCQ